MAGPEDATAQEWDLRWQLALAKALGPRRDFVLKRRELFRTSESGVLAADGAWLNNEVPPDDASIAVHEPSVILGAIAFESRPACLVALVGCTSQYPAGTTRCHTNGPARIG